jgi:soluble lytic murein transglycosylase-like protein
MNDELSEYLKQFKTSVSNPVEPKPKQPTPKAPSIDSKIDEYSTRNGVDSNFVRAVMGQESGGNPTAKSWANAKGLLQIIPETGRQYRKDFDPYNVDHNLDVGTRHLAYLEKKYKGDKKRVLAAYNAGEKNADRNDWYEKSQFWSNDPNVQKGLKPRGPEDKTKLH